MATTVPEAFRQLKANLEISDLQESTVATRQKNVRAALTDDFDIVEDFLTGSYRRSTLIAPLKTADVDIFVALAPRHFAQHGQKALLESVKRALKKTYPATPDISPNGQAVTITFTDFKVDVVPGFKRQGGGYYIPDAELGRWISTDPKRHVEIWSTSNKAHNGDLVPLLKMLKGWNISRKLYRSFHLETAALKVLDNVNISDYPSGLRYLFDKLREPLKSKLPDPSGYSDDVSAHITTQAQIDKIVGRLNWALETARAAERLAAAGDAKGAIERWKLIIPDYFPAYR